MNAQLGARTEIIRLCRGCLPRGEGQHLPSETRAMLMFARRRPRVLSVDSGFHFGRNAAGGPRAAYLQGILRTLPPPDSQAVARLRLTAQALHIDWPDAQSYPDFIRTLDPAQPKHIAMMLACTAVLRGAGYSAFDGGTPAQPMQSAVAAEYAHVTAPMGRLVDRYANEVCVALCSQQPIPDWVRSALPGLPETMRTADRNAHRYERAIIDLAESVILAPRIGEIIAGAVIEISHGGGARGKATQGSACSGIVMLRDPPVEAKV